MKAIDKAGTLNIRGSVTGQAGGRRTLPEDGHQIAHVDPSRDGAIEFLALVLRCSQPVRLRLETTEAGARLIQPINLPRQATFGWPSHFPLEERKKVLP